MHERQTKLNCFSDVKRIALYEYVSPKQSIKHPTSKFRNVYGGEFIEKSLVGQIYLHIMTNNLKKLTRWRGHDPP
jgi:hypothetical protein